jgi:hypothetical protein
MLGAGGEFTRTLIPTGIVFARELFARELPAHVSLPGTAVADGD